MSTVLAWLLQKDELRENAFQSCWLSLSNSSPAGKFCSSDSPHTQPMPFSSISATMELSEPWMISSHSVLRLRLGSSIFLRACSVCGRVFGSECLGFCGGREFFWGFFLLFFFQPTKQAMLSLQRLKEIFSGNPCSTRPRSTDWPFSSLLFFCLLARIPETFKMLL